MAEDRKQTIENRSQKSSPMIRSDRIKLRDSEVLLKKATSFWTSYKPQAVTPLLMACDLKPMTLLWHKTKGFRKYFKKLVALIVAQTFLVTSLILPSPAYSLTQKPDSHLAPPLFLGKQGSMRRGSNGYLNPFLTKVLAETKEAIKTEGISDDIAEALLQTQNIHKAEIPVKVNGEEWNLFVVRCQDNNWRGQFKGGIRLIFAGDDPLGRALNERLEALSQRPHTQEELQVLVEDSQEWTTQEGRAMSKDMTWKVALANLLYGGGKAQILGVLYRRNREGRIVEVKPLRQKELLRDDRRNMMRAIGADWARQGIIRYDIDIPAPDVNTTGEDMAWILDGALEVRAKELGLTPTNEDKKHSLDVPYLVAAHRKEAREIGMITGKPTDLGGLKVRNIATGLGASYVISRALEEPEIRSKMKNPDAPIEAITGFGNAGRFGALEEIKRGKKIVAINDTGGAVLKEKGFSEDDINILIKAKENKQSVVDVADKVGAKAVRGKDEGDRAVLEADADILLLASVEDVIHTDPERPGYVGRVKARLIAEAANGPITRQADQELSSRGVFVLPDILASAGGVIVSFWEWWLNDPANKRMTDDEIAEDVNTRMRTNFSEMWSLVKSENISLRKAATRIAIRRVVAARQTIKHPEDYLAIGKAIDTIQNAPIKEWINGKAGFLGAGGIEVIDATDEQRLFDLAVKEGVLTALPDGNYHHRSHPKDTARAEAPTHIATDDPADKGIFNNWMHADEAKKQLKDRAYGSYKGKKMYVIPFIMFPGSPIEMVGVQVTDSIYGAISLLELVKVGQAVIGDSALQKLNSANPDEVLKIWHSTGDLDKIRRATKPDEPEDRLFVEFPKEREVGLFGSAYGGNLLGPKKFGLRLAQYIAYQNVKRARDKGESIPPNTLVLAEHAALIELINKKTSKTYRIMLFGPSASGKSTFATYLPPDELADDWEVLTISDDLVGMWFDEEGYLVGANPEDGLFAVAPKTSPRTNARLVEATLSPKVKPGNKPVIFTNTAINRKTGKVWWEELTDTVPIDVSELEQYERWVKGETDTPPKSLEGWQDWTGQPIAERPQGKRGEKWAHPNARFTLNKVNLETRSPNWHKGGRIDAIFFGGKIPDGQPPLVQLNTPERAILDAFFMAPEETFAVEGAVVGRRRPDPFALRPFYATTERQHLDTWLYVMKQAKQNGKAPAFFHFDQFRKGWPGFRQDVRLIMLALAMAGKFEGMKVEAIDTPIGRIPNPEAVKLFLKGLNIAPEVIVDMFSYHHRYGASEALRWVLFLKEIEAKGFQLPDELQPLYQELIREATEELTTELSKVNTVLFDLTGTLLTDGLNDCIDKMNKIFGVDEDTLRVWLQTSNEAKDFRLGKISADEYWSYVLNKLLRETIGKPKTKKAIEFFELGKDKRKETLKLYLYDAYKEIPGVAELVKAISERGYNLAILTNMEKERAEYLKKKFPFLQNVRIITSAELGELKPESKAFDEAFKILKREFGITSAEELILIDDEPKNFEHPRQLNWRTLQVDSAKGIAGEYPEIQFLINRNAPIQLNLVAREAFDSRGKSTVEAVLRLGDIEVTGTVPAGASKGEDEAKTVTTEQAIRNVNEIITQLLMQSGLDLRKYEDLIKMEQLIIEKAGENFAVLGANAVVPVSWALWKMAAKLQGMELWEYIRKYEPDAVSDKTEPVYFYMNIYNGGLHALKKAEGEVLGKDRIDIQEIMIVPVGAKSYREQLEMGDMIDSALKEILLGRFDAKTIKRADEAGFSVKGLGNSTEAIGYVFEAIEKAGYRVGEDVKLALDVAASSFYDKDRGVYNFQGKAWTSDKMIDYYVQLAEQYAGKIISIEDGLAENDWEGWQKLTKEMMRRGVRTKRGIRTVGDDLFVTQLQRLNKGIEMEAATDILIKVNQNGTMYGTLEAIKAAKRAGMGWIISHRSGETMDNGIADLAYATNAFGLKTGDPQPPYDFAEGGQYQGQPLVRRVKYLRMIEIEEQTKKVKLVKRISDVLASAYKLVEDHFKGKAKGDEFVLPIVVVDEDGNPIGRVKDGDTLFFVNFRTDRPRQLIWWFTGQNYEDRAGDVERGKVPQVEFVTMTQYDGAFTVPVVLKTPPLTNTYGEVLAAHGIRQMRRAEDAKIKHVTYFLDGEKQEKSEGEEWGLIPSQQVATYNSAPEMKAVELANAVISDMRSGIEDIVLNFANADMLGHTGDFEAAKKGIEVVDEQLGRLIEEAKRQGYIVVITADHGNAEQMVDKSGKLLTSHTSNPVPFIIIGLDGQVSLREGGNLTNVAPTLLHLRRIEKPQEMDQESLITSPLNTTHNKILTIVLDGWGIRKETEGNAIAQANTPNMDTFWKQYPHTSLKASEIPSSENGHREIGAGRRLMTARELINESIQDSSFFQNETLVQAMQQVKQKGTTLHLLGLLSDGNVHSSMEHWFATLELAKRLGLKSEQVVIHAFLDGRDTSPDSAKKYLDELQTKCDELGVGRIVDAMGRYWGMDRENKWDRTGLAARALINGEAAQYVKITSQNTTTESYAMTVPTTPTQGSLAEAILDLYSAGRKGLINANSIITTDGYVETDGKKKRWRKLHRTRGAPRREAKPFSRTTLTWELDGLASLGFFTKEKVKTDKGQRLEYRPTEKFFILLEARQAQLNEIANLPAFQHPSVFEAFSTKNLTELILGINNILLKIAEDRVFEILKQRKSLSVKELEESGVAGSYSAEEVLEALARSKWIVKKEIVDGEVRYFYRPMRLMAQANEKTNIKLLKSLGADGILSGHSESRVAHELTDEDVNALLKQADGIMGGINVLAVGEPAEMRYPKDDANEGKLKEEGWNFIRSQVVNGLAGRTREQILNTIIAYEPIWAIGEKAIRPATPQEAEEVQGFIKGILRELVGGDADKVVIQYGGSMNAKNAAGLMVEVDIDGGLIGGASLTKEAALSLIRAIVETVRAQKKSGTFSGRIPTLGFNLKAEVGGAKMEAAYLRELMDIFKFIEANLSDIDLENDIRIFFAVSDTDISLFDRALRGESPADLFDLNQATLPNGMELAVDIKWLSPFKPGAHTSDITAEALRLAGVKHVIVADEVTEDDPRVIRAEEAGLKVVGLREKNIVLISDLVYLRDLLKEVVEEGSYKNCLIVIPPSLAREAYVYASTIPLTVAHRAPLRKTVVKEKGVYKSYKAEGQLELVVEGLVKVSHKFAKEPRPLYTAEELRRINANLSGALATWQAYLNSHGVNSSYAARRFPGSSYSFKTRFFVDPDNEFYISNPGDGFLEIDDEWTMLPAILQTLLLNHEANLTESVALDEDLLFYAWLKKNRSEELEAALKAHPELARQPYFAFLEKNWNKYAEDKKKAIIRFMMQEELRQAGRAVETGLIEKGNFEIAAQILDKLRDIFVALCFDQGKAGEDFYLVPDAMAPLVYLLKSKEPPNPEELLRRLKGLILQDDFRGSISNVWDLSAEGKRKMAEILLRHKEALDEILLPLYNLRHYERENIDRHEIKTQVSIGKIYYAVDKDYRNRRFYISLGSIDGINFFLNWPAASGEAISLVEAGDLAYQMEKGQVRILGRLSTDESALNKEDRFKDISARLSRLIENAEPRVSEAFHSLHYVSTLNDMAASRTSSGSGHPAPVSKPSESLLQTVSEEFARIVQTTGLPSSQLTEILLNATAVQVFITRLAELSRKNPEDILNILSKQPLLKGLVSRYKLEQIAATDVPPTIPAERQTRLKAGDLVDAEKVSGYSKHGVAISVSLPKDEVIVDREELAVVRRLHSEVQDIMQNKESQPEERRGNLNYRGEVKEYYNEEFSAVAEQLDEYVAEHFRGIENVDWLFVMGMGANEFLLHEMMRLQEEMREGGTLGKRPRLILVNNPVELERILSEHPDIQDDNSLWIYLSRSGETTETEKVLGFTHNKFTHNIAFANQGALKILGERFADAGARVFPFSPKRNIGGRFMRRKTEMVYGPFYLAFGPKITQRYVEVTDTADQKLSFTKKDGFAFQLARFIDVNMRLGRRQNIAMVIGSERLMPKAKELRQWVMEGVNKPEALSPTLLSIYPPGDKSLDRVAENMADDHIVIVLLDKSDPGYAEASKKAESLKQRMPVIVIEIEKMTIESSAELTTLFEDTIASYSHMVNQDHYSNPMVRRVRNEGAVALAQLGERTRERHRITVEVGELPVAKGRPDETDILRGDEEVKPDEAAISLWKQFSLLAEEIGISYEDMLAVLFDEAINAFKFCVDSAENAKMLRSISMANKIQNLPIFGRLTPRYKNAVSLKAGVAKADVFVKTGVLNTAAQALGIDVNISLGEASYNESAVKARREQFEAQISPIIQRAEAQGDQKTLLAIQLATFLALAYAEDPARQYINFLVNNSSLKLLTRAFKESVSGKNGMIVFTGELPTDSHSYIEGVIGQSARFLDILILARDYERPEGKALESLLKVDDVHTPHHIGLSVADVNYGLAKGNANALAAKSPTIVITVDKLDQATIRTLSDIFAKSAELISQARIFGRGDTVEAFFSSGALREAEQRYEEIEDVMPGTNVLIFDNDQFLTWPVIDLSAEELEEIIKGKKPMPAKYRLSPDNYVLLTKYLSRGGILVILSGGDLNNLLLRVVDILPAHLRRQIIIAHCGGKQVYTFDEQGNLVDRPAIDFVAEFFEERKIDEEGRASFEREWMAAIDKAAEFFSLDSTEVVEVSIPRVRVDRRYDRRGYQQGHPVQVTFEFDSRNAALNSLAGQKKQQVVEELNRRIRDFNQQNSEANIPQLSLSDEKYDLRIPLKEYLQFLYKKTEREKGIALTNLGLSLPGTGALDTGIEGINKRVVTTAIIDRGLIEGLLGRKIDGLEILVGEDSPSSLVAMLSGIANASSEEINNADKARGLLVPEKTPLDDDPFLAGLRDRITIILGKYGPACEGLTKYMIDSLGRRSDSVVDCKFCALKNGVVTVQEKQIDLSKCAKDEVIVRVALAGICRADVKEVTSSRDIPEDRGPLFGHELVGEIVAAGKDTGFKVGDRITFNPNITPDRTTGFAEYFSVRGARVKEALNIVPEEIPLEKAVLSEPLACVVRSVDKLLSHMGVSDLRGKRVAVIGAGNVGTMHLLLAKNLGAEEIVALDIDSNRLDFLRKQGLFDGRTKLFNKEGIEENLGEDGGKFDVVIVVPTAITPKTLRVASQLITNDGVIHLYGGTRKGDIFAGADIDSIRRNETKERAMIDDKMLFLSGAYGAESPDFQKAFGLLQNPELPFERLVSTKIDLRGLPSYITAMAKGDEDPPGKVVVQPSTMGGIWQKLPQAAEIAIRLVDLLPYLEKTFKDGFDGLAQQIAVSLPPYIKISELSFMVCSDGLWIVGPEQEDKPQVFMRINPNKQAGISEGIKKVVEVSEAELVSEDVDIGTVTRISIAASEPAARREMIRQIVANLITEKKKIADGLTYEEPAYSITPLMQRFIFGAKLEIEFLKGFEKAAEKARTQYPELAALIEHLKDPNSGPFKLEITKELAEKWNLKKGLADVVKAMAPIAVAGMRNSQNPLAPFDLNSPMNILLTLLLGNELAETALKIAAEQEATMTETIIGGEVRYNTPLVSEMLRRRFAKLGIIVHSPSRGTYLPIGATSFITTVLNIMFTMYDTASHSARNIYASKLMGNLRPPISPFIEANLEKLGIDVKAYRRARSEGAQLLIEDMVALADNIGRKIDDILETGKPLIIEFASSSDEHIHFDIESPVDANNIPVSDKYAKYLRGSYVTSSNIQAVQEALANGLKIGFDQARGSAYQFFRGVFEKVFNRETVGKIVWTGTIPDSFFGDTGMTDFNQKQPPDEFVKRYVEKISTRLDEFFGNLPLTYVLVATISERELASNIGETPRQDKENDVVNIKFKIYAKEEEGLLKRLGVPYRKLANSNLLAYYRPKMADISEDVSLLQVVAASKLPVFMLNQPIGFVYPTTDPDGDRFVLMQVEKNDKETKQRLEHLNIAYLVLSDEKILAVYVPNQTFLQIQDAYIEQLKEEGKWSQNIEDPNAATFFSIKTTVSSSAWLELSNGEDIPVVQVPVGFKEIGSIMRKVELQLMINEVRHKLGLKPRMVVIHDIFGNPIRLGYNPRLLFAGEESGGMVVGSTELLTTEDGLRRYLSWREKNAVEASVLTFIMISKRFNKAREAALKRGVNETGLYQDAEFLQDISLSNMLQKIIEQKQMQNTAELRTDVDLVDVLATAQATPERRKEMLDVGFEWRDNNFAFFLSLAFALESGNITLNDVKAILKEVLVKDEVMVAKIKAVTDDKALEDLLKQIDDLQRYLFTGDAVYMEFSNGTWEIIRPSGTEARIKSYPSTADARISAILSNAIGEVHPKMFFELAKGDTEEPDMPNTAAYIAKMRTNDPSLIDRDKILDRKQAQYQRGLEVDTMPDWFANSEIQKLLLKLLPETETITSAHIFLGPKTQKEPLVYNEEANIIYISWEFENHMQKLFKAEQLINTNPQGVINVLSNAKSEFEAILSTWPAALTPAPLGPLLLFAAYYNSIMDRAQTIINTDNWLTFNYATNFQKPKEGFRNLIVLQPHMLAQALGLQLSINSLLASDEGITVVVDKEGIQEGEIDSYLELAGLKDLVSSGKVQLKTKRGIEELMGSGEYNKIVRAGTKEYLDGWRLERENLFNLQVNEAPENTANLGIFPAVRSIALNAPIEGLVKKLSDTTFALIPTGNIPQGYSDQLNSYRAMLGAK